MDVTWRMKKVWFQIRYIHLCPLGVIHKLVKTGCVCGELTVKSDNVSVRPGVGFSPDAGELGITFPNSDPTVGERAVKRTLKIVDLIGSLPVSLSL